MLRDKRIVLGVAVGAAVLVALLPFLVSKYMLFLLTTAVIAAIVARSVGVVTNQAGLLSLCQMSFAAIGGWVVSWLSAERVALPFPVLVLLGGVAALPLGVLVGLPALRVRGVELAVVTLAVAVSVDQYVRRGSFPGAGEGKAVVPNRPFDSARPFFWLCWGAFLLVCVGLWWMSRRRVGASWTAVRISERATASLGISVPLTKITAFGVAAFVAGLAGGLFAGQYGLLTSDVFNPVTSMVFFAVALTCGALYASGAVIAGALVTFVPEILRRLGLPLDLGDLIFAIGAIDALRRGHGGLADQGVAAIQQRQFREARRTCELVRTLPDQADVRGPASDDAYVLSTRGLRVEYGSVIALNDVDLSVSAGQVHALIGPNGAGKSTFVDAVTGFVANYSGSVTLNGTAIDNRSATARARLGLRRTFQQGRTIEALTVRSYLLLAGQGGKGHDPDELIAFFGLPEGDLPIRLLDAGTRRVLEIAATVAASPSVVLLDEPAAGLDEEPSHWLAQRIAAIPGSFGASVLLIEHDMQHVRLAADAVTVLDFGTVIATGPTDAVLADPNVIKAYLGQEVETL